MPEFFSHLVDVSKSSANKLKSGAEGMIKKVGSGVSIHLGEANHKKCMNAYKKNKGCRIKLSAEEIVQNDSIDGSGFFQFLNKNLGISRKQFTKGAKQVGRELAIRGAPIIKEMGQKAIPALTASISAETGVPAFLLNQQLNNALDRGTDRLAQFGKEGKGFRTAGSGFRPVGVNVPMYGTGIATMRPDYIDGQSPIVPINHPTYNGVKPSVKFGL
jgi:hypothetical protein